MIDNFQLEQTLEDEEPGRRLLATETGKHESDVSVVIGSALKNTREDSELQKHIAEGLVI
jgi:hypothetical protein